MKNSVIILYDPKTNLITMVKYGDFEVLICIVEAFTIVAMKLKERVLFFEIDDDEKVYINFLMDHTGQNVEYLKNFRHAKYTIKEI